LHPHASGCFDNACCAPSHSPPRSELKQEEYEFRKAEQQGRPGVVYLIRVVSETGRVLSQWYVGITGGTQLEGAK
jgi:hypothetical protein